MIKETSQGTPRRVLITGCAGFIGSHLAKGFIAQGHKVIGLDNLSGGTMANLPRQPDMNFQFYQADLTDYTAVHEVFMAEAPEIVYHCASCAREGASEFQPYKITQTNMQASLLLLEVAIKRGIRKLIFTSSMSVYGNQKCPFDEKMPRKPVDPYGIQKAAIEHTIEVMSETHRLLWTILRAHNVIGSYQSITDPWRNVAGIFCNRIMRHEPIHIFGEDHIRAFSNIEDSLPAMMRAADLDTANGEIINIGGKEPVKVKDLAEEVIQAFPDYERPKIIQLPPRPHEVKEAWCTTKKSEEILGYQEVYGWRAGIKKTAEYAKALGPQPWRIDDLPLINEKAPEPWQELLKR